MCGGAIDYHAQAHTALLRVVGYHVTRRATQLNAVGIYAKARPTVHAVGDYGVFVRADAALELQFHGASLPVAIRPEVRAERQEVLQRDVLACANCHALPVDKAVVVVEPEVVRTYQSRRLPAAICGHDVLCAFVTIGPAAHGQVHLALVGRCEIYAQPLHFNLALGRHATNRETHRHLGQVLGLVECHIERLQAATVVRVQRYLLNGELAHVLSATVQQFGLHRYGRTGIFVWQVEVVGQPGHAELARSGGDTLAKAKGSHAARTRRGLDVGGGYVWRAEAQFLIFGPQHDNMCAAAVAVLLVDDELARGVVDALCERVGATAVLYAAIHRGRHTLAQHAQRPTRRLYLALVVCWVELQREAVRVDVEGEYLLRAVRIGHAQLHLIGLGRKQVAQLECVDVGRGRAAGLELARQCGSCHTVHLYCRRAVLRVAVGRVVAPVAVVCQAHGVLRTTRHVGGGVARDDGAHGVALHGFIAVQGELAQHAVGVCRAVGKPIGIRMFVAEEPYRLQRVLAAFDVNEAELRAVEFREVFFQEFLDARPLVSLPGCGEVVYLLVYSVGHVYFQFSLSTQFFSLIHTPEPKQLRMAVHTSRAPRYTAVIALVP